MALSIRPTLLLLLALPTSARAGDVSLQLDAGAGFSVKDATATVERLRVDEATGNVSRNGALFVHTTGTNNLFVGAGAGNPATTAVSNSGFGAGTLAATTTGYANSAFGEGALAANETGAQNSAFGPRALFSNTAGDANSAFGAFALYYNVSHSNSAFGSSALGANTAGYANSALGQAALIHNTTGGRNSAVGRAALWNNTTGIWNSAFGTGALRFNTTGSNNIAIGVYAGADQTTGSDNIYLAHAGVAAESGQIRIGTVGTHVQAHVAGIHGRTSAGGIAVLVNASGVLGTTTSSARFKEEVRDMGGDSDLLMQLRPVTFRYREDAVGAEDSRVPQYGLIAEEVAEVAPELVAPDLEGRPYSVKYHELPALLLNELQQAERRNDEQERRIARQDQVIAGLQARLTALERREHDKAREEVTR
jgi:hypothetical protein